MNNLDKYLSEELKNDLQEAIKKCNELNHQYLGTEHLLLAILDSNKENNYNYEEGYQDPFIQDVFCEFGMYYDDIYKKINDIIGQGKDNLSSTTKLWTPKLKECIINQISIAKEIDMVVDTGDVLIEILNSDCVASRIINQIICNNNDLNCATLHNLIEDLKQELNPTAFLDNVDSGVERNILDIMSDGYEEEENKNMNDNGIYKLYDVDISIDGENIINLTKISIFFVNEDTLNIIKNGKFNYNLEMKDYLKCKYYPFNNKDRRINSKRTECIDAALFVTYDLDNEVYKSIGVKFKSQSNGNFVSDIKFELTELGNDELFGLCSELKRYQNKLLTKDIDNYISGFKSQKKNIIYNSNDIYEKVEEIERNNAEEENKSRLRKINLNKLEKCNDLTNINKKVKKDETIIVGLDEELEALIKNLTHMRKPNVMVLGEPGVGKTALIEKLAIEINKGNVPDKFKNVIIYEWSMSSAVAGTKYRGEFEEKVMNILDIIKNEKDIILFIDEAHTIIGAGGAEGAIDASNIFKPMLARGEIKMICATTKKEYDEYIKPDGAFIRRFNNIEILEPMEKEVKSIMKGLKPKLEKFYNLKIENEIINECYNKSKMSKNKMPDAALDELENYCIDKYYDNFKISKIEMKKDDIKEKEMV